jgi:CelD/BcsL family acetyltransferase involved in cellulose biosynthesis
VGTAGARAGEGINVEYNRLLVEPGSRAAFSVALLDTLVRAPDWDELVLDGFALEEAEPLLRAMPSFKPSVRSSPYLDLRAGRAAGGDVLAPLSTGTRRRLRRSMRGFGPLETEWAETPERALHVLDDLIALHQRRWRSAGQHGAFATERFRRFHRTLIVRLLPSGRIMAFRVRGAEGTIGCVYGFVERGRVLFYQSGFESFEDNKLKPGLVTHALCIEAAAERGLVEYDFLPGGSRYKEELSTGEHQVVWATARRRHLKSRVVDGQRRFKRAVGRLRA